MMESPDKHFSLESFLKVILSHCCCSDTVVVAVVADADVVAASVAKVVASSVDGGVAVSSCACALEV